MAYENRKFVFITLADYTNSQLEDLVENAIESNVNTLRKNKDNTKTFLKWDGETPDIFNGMTTYTHLEIKDILKGSDWTWDVED